MAKIEEFISPSIVQNLGQELLNAIGTEINTADTSLFQRKSFNFRDVIDSSFPTMLVVDYSSIKNELKQYQDIDTALKTYISETYQPTAKDYSAEKFSDSEISMILRAVRLGIKQVPATSISYKNLQAKLQKIVSSDSESNTIIQQVKQLFSITYKLTGVSTTGDTEVLIFPNFTRISDTLRKYLDVGLSVAETEAASSISSLNSIGSILAYGHTALGYVDDSGNVKLNFNSPKTIAVMFDAIQSSTNSPKANAIQESLKAASFFVNDTKQTEVYVTIDKEFSDGFVKLFVSVGGNSVKFENSLINSRRGSVLESSKKYGGINKVVLDKLAKAFSNTQSTIGSRLARYILNKKSSPSLTDYVMYNITTAFTGEKASSFTGKSTDILKAEKLNIPKEVISGIVKSTVTLSKQPKPPTIRTVSGQFYSLASLQQLLNDNLQNVVSANMGDGGRKDILNYQTGRFAASVKVERLSQSREGMITAYYNYMKNPYQTFEPGYKQGAPKTRDPKLLIAKSIREIAETKVANRMRAVLV